MSLEKSDLHRDLHRFLSNSIKNGISRFLHSIKHIMVAVEAHELIKVKCLCGREMSGISAVQSDTWTIFFGLVDGVCEQHKSHVTFFWHLHGHISMSHRHWLKSGVLRTSWHASSSCAHDVVSSLCCRSSLPSSFFILLVFTIFFNDMYFAHTRE